MSRQDRSRLILAVGLMCYLLGIIPWYFFWYKDGDIFHFLLIALFVGGTMIFVMEYKARNVILKDARPYKSLITILFMGLFFAGGVYVNNSAKERVDDILTYEPTKTAVAMIVSIDLKSTRSGKQPCARIKYQVEGGVIEQSFAAIDKKTTIGNRYLIEYSIEYPDMFRILKRFK